MGAKLPLPKRIPKPDSKFSELMMVVGFCFYDVHDVVYRGRSMIQFIKYTMPKGWKLVRRSDSNHQVEFMFVDSCGNDCIKIYGVWNSLWGDKLKYELVN